MRQRFSSYQKSVALSHVHTSFVGRSFQDPHKVMKPIPFLAPHSQKEPNQSSKGAGQPSPLGAF